MFSSEDLYEGDLKTSLILTTSMFLILIFVMLQVIFGDASSKGSEVQEASNNFFSMMLWLFYIVLNAKTSNFYYFCQIFLGS